MTAGQRLATAEPEVVRMAVGRPVVRAWPRAAKAMPRSSKWMRERSLGNCDAAATMGTERAPGAR